MVWIALSLLAFVTVLVGLNTIAGRWSMGHWRWWWSRGNPTQMPGGRPDPGCARDVSRFCRAHMDEGDQVILACLKQNRARLSKVCAKVLTDHGQ